MEVSKKEVKRKVSGHTTENEEGREGGGIVTPGHGWFCGVVLGKDWWMNDGYRIGLFSMRILGLEYEGDSSCSRAYQINPN